MEGIESFCATDILLTDVQHNKLLLYNFVQANLWAKVIANLFSNDGDQFRLPSECHSSTTIVYLLT